MYVSPCQYSDQTTGWMTGVIFPAGSITGIFLFTAASRPSLGQTQLPIGLARKALTQGVKRLGREADHSFASSSEVKNMWSCTSTAPIRLDGAVLRAPEGQFFTSFIFSHYLSTSSSFMSFSSILERNLLAEMEANKHS